MNQPSVVAVTLTRDRPEMARFALGCFRKQTYPNKSLLIFDTGDQSAINRQLQDNEQWWWECAGGRSIGDLRNHANARTPRADILIHFDDDDWSHPERIAEQVAFLQASGADAVGYREMLFWREDQRGGRWPDEVPWEVRGESWLYSSPNPNYCLGTSLCYWRKTWERMPFPDRNVGEDSEWQKKIKTASVSSFVGGFHQPDGFTPPRMVARIHSGNTSGAYHPEKMARAESNQWRRVPEWDEFARSVFA